MKIDVRGLADNWGLAADLLGGHSDGQAAAGQGPTRGLLWSTEHIWYESGYPEMTFPTKEAAEKYLRVHRKKLEKAPIQP